MNPCGHTTQYACAGVPLPCADPRCAGSSPGEHLKMWLGWTGWIRLFSREPDGESYRWTLVIERDAPPEPKGRWLGGV